MICAMRKQAPIIIVLGFFFLTLTAAAQVVNSATQITGEYVTKVELYVTLASVLITILGACAGVLAFILSRERDYQQAHFDTLNKVVTEMGQSVKDLVKVLELHNKDPFAHPEGSANRLNPIQEDLKEIKEIVIKLSTEHDLMQEEENNVCALIKRSSLIKEFKKRQNDPEDFDPKDLRGK